MNLLLKGLLLGFSVAAPVGPIGLLCIKRTLSEGKLSGFVSGLGAATADLVYGCIAAFGLTAISSFLLYYKQPIQIVGGIFLVYLAVKIFFSRVPEKSALGDIDVSLTKSYISTFFLTITNPVTIISFMAMFAGLGIIAAVGNYFQSVIVVIGVFLGSAIWWLTLSMIVGLFHKKISSRTMYWINIIAAVFILLLACFSFI